MTTEITIPCAPDIEAVILATVLTDSAAVSEIVGLCCVNDFSTAINRILFTAVQTLHAENIVPDIVCVNEHLKGSQVYSDAGGAGYISELIERTVSTANVPYYAKILREASGKRFLQKELQASLMDCGNGKGISEITESLKTAVLQAENADLAKSETAKLVYVPAWDNIAPETPALLTLNDVKLLSTGNLSLIIAGNGHGKSALCEAICTAAIKPEADAFGFSAGRGLVHYVDTERSQQDHARSWLRTMTRAGLQQGQTAENLRFELISCLPSIDARRRYLEQSVKAPGLSLIILDGLADFVPDTNDAETSNAFLFWLLSEAKARYFGIVATLHPNPNDADKKGRGHLGSEAMRRAESVLAIQKDAETGTRTITMDFRHGKNRNDGDTVSSSFSWNDDEAMFTSCDAPAAPKAKTVLDREAITALVASRPEWIYTDLRTAVMNDIGKSERCAAYKIKDLITLGKIVKNDNGTYSAPVKKQPEIAEYTNV